MEYIGRYLLYVCICFRKKVGKNVYVCKIFLKMYRKLVISVGCQWGADLGSWESGVESCVIAEGRE